MEFLRFGSYIPGDYWGCCAVDIIQNFKQDPDEKASIQIVSGDSGDSLMKDGELVFAGPTWRDIFWQRLRVGTFNQSEKPNHTFLAVLTDSQIQSGHGKKWLAILREAGFEFIRTVDNSVYTGANLAALGAGVSHKNHIFGLFRNIGSGNIEDPFTPPKEWTELPSVKTEPPFLVDPVCLAQKQHEEDTAIWNAHPAPLVKESDIVKAGAPVIMAGLLTEDDKRKKQPTRRPEPKADREAFLAKGKVKPAADPFATVAIEGVPG